MDIPNADLSLDDLAALDHRQILLFELEGLAGSNTSKGGERCGVESNGLRSTNRLHGRPDVDLLDHVVAEIISVHRGARSDAEEISKHSA